MSLSLLCAGLQPGLLVLQPGDSFELDISGTGVPLVVLAVTPALLERIRVALHDGALRMSAPSWVEIEQQVEARRDALRADIDARLAAKAQRRGLAG